MNNQEYIINDKKQEIRMEVEIKDIDSVIQYLEDIKKDGILH